MIRFERFMKEFCFILLITWAVVHAIGAASRELTVRELTNIINEEK